MNNNNSLAHRMEASQVSVSKAVFQEQQITMILCLEEQQCCGWMKSLLYVQPPMLGKLVPQILI